MRLACLGLSLSMLAATACRAGFDPEESARFALKGGGDAAKGRLLFAERVGCRDCHKVGGEGGIVGPDLADIGGKYGRAQLVESVLVPSRQVVEGYRPEVVALDDGRVVTGLVRGESDGSLTLLVASGERLELSKGEIEARKPGAASIMPEGLVSGLSPREFADLIAYLESLRPVAPIPGGGQITLPAGFTRTRVAEGITGATAMAVAPDGRVFVCEQTGALRIIKGDVLLPGPFATLKVDSQWERGLIGVAIDPRFAENRRVYACYVAAEPFPHHRISRFVDGGDVAVGGEEVLFEGDDQSKQGGDMPSGHQGGAIHFGLDDKLYVAIGDQTAGRPSQAMDSLLGKILRLEPDGSIPEDNPFARSARGKYRAIWALGLRNPFTFAIQPGTGKMLINDVGGVAEEVDEGVAGANYGWPVVEHGPTADPRFRGPIYSYPTSSIGGSDFCPESGPFPDAYRGRYFFMDFMKGWIKALDPGRPAEPATFGGGLSRPVDLKFAPDGGLYVLSRDAWVIDADFRPGTGTLDKIRPPARVSRGP